MSIPRCRSLFAALVLFASAWHAAAQQPTSAQASTIRQACRADFQAHCAGVPTGGSAALACLQQHAAGLSSACQQALRAVSGGAAAPAAVSVTAAAPPAADTGAKNWPHTVRAEGGSAVVYQPQVISWPDRQTMSTRIAMALTPAGAKTAVLGSAEVSFATHADMATRQVSLSEPKLLSSRFPAADTAQAQRFEEAIRKALAALGDKRVPLDMVLLSLRQSNATPPGVPVHNEPPAIFVSQRPASLLVFDGEPVMAPVAGTPLTVAVNTNWDVFVDGPSKQWYWLNNGAWLRAADFMGPWAPAGTLPAAFSALPDDRNFADVRKQVPGRSLTPAELPQVFASTTPAEIIVIQGAPQ